MNPLSARIVCFNQDKTTVAVDVFGHQISLTFTGAFHHDEATAWVKDWSRHFDREWDAVKGTTATIMEDFVRALQKQGVDQASIDAAVDEMRTYAEQG